MGNESWEAHAGEQERIRLGYLSQDDVLTANACSCSDPELSGISEKEPETYHRSEASRPLPRPVSEPAPPTLSVEIASCAPRQLSGGIFLTGCSLVAPTDRRRSQPHGKRSEFSERITITSPPHQSAKKPPALCRANKKSHNKRSTRWKKNISGKPMRVFTTVTEISVVS